MEQTENKFEKKFRLFLYYLWMGIWALGGISIYPLGGYVFYKMWLSTSHKDLVNIGISFLFLLFLVGVVTLLGYVLFKLISSFNPNYVDPDDKN